MKKFLFFGLILISTISFSQSPQYLNYQGIARDAAGTVINSGNIGIRFEIWRTSPSGTKVYQEEISATPSTAGVFTTAIGSGSATIMGSFTSINWANGPYFIAVAIDPTGGTSFSTVGTSQLLSVPYALYAEKAGNAQTVNLSGPNVLGAYPNYTITAGSAYSAGAGISISSGSIINTAMNQTVSINQSGVANVLGTYPNYIVDVPNPGLNYNTGTQVLTLTQGTAVSTATISSTSTSVSIVGAGVSGAYPSYTISPPPATSVTAGNSNITVSGTGPGFTVSSVPTLSLSGAALSISNGNTVTLPTGTTYTNGVGIALTSGTIITNTAPDQTVTIANGTNVNVTGTYPNFVVNSTPTLSIATNTISISGGNSITLPAPPVYTAGAGIAILGSTITNTSPNQTVTVTGPSVTGSYPSFNVAAQTTSVTAGNSNITVTGTAPNFTVASSPTLTVAGNNLTISNGNTVTLPLATPNTSITGSGIAVITPAGTNTFNIAVAAATLTGAGATTVSGSYPNFTITSPTTAAAVTPTIIGSGIAVVTPTTGNNFTVAVTSPTFTGVGSTTVSGAYPSYTISTPTPTAPPPAWSLLGNAGTIVGTNFLGTTDGQPLMFKVNNQKSGVIDQTNNNAFFGHQAGNSTSTVFSGNGYGNAALGESALFANTSGNYNTAIGMVALRNNTSGSNNTAIGQNALNANTTGNNNTANGMFALFSNNTGYNNTAYGYQALYSNTTGFQNTSYGYGALYSNTTGYNSVAYGYQALYANTTGSFNTANGLQALYSNTAGSLNTANGYATLINNTTGNNNIANGSYALVSNTTGSNNTSLGSFAGYSNSVGSGNVFLGYQAGYNELGSDKLYIANSSTNPPLIYGDFAAGFVGLGTTTPSSKLEVIAGVSSGQSMLVTNNIASGVSGSSAAFNNTGNRSIGNSGVIVNNLVTKTGGNNSTKVGLEVNSTGAWGVSTVNQPNVGIKVVASGADNNYALQLVDGTQANGKVLTSDAAGLATWQKGSRYNYFYPNANSVANLGTAPVMVPGMSYSFTKVEAGTTLDIDFIGHASASGMGGQGIIVEIRVDGVNCTSFSGRAIYWSTDSPNFKNMNMHGVVEFLAAGVHTVEIWVSSSAGTTSSVFVNPGNWADQIIVKETH